MQTTEAMNKLFDLIRTDHARMHEDFNTLFNALLTLPPDTADRQALIKFKMVIDMLGKCDVPIC